PVQSMSMQRIVLPAALAAVVVAASPAFAQQPRSMGGGFLEFLFNGGAAPPRYQQAAPVYPQQQPLYQQQPQAYQQQGYDPQQQAPAYYQQQPGPYYQQQPG